jgi:hypothetical protein
MRRRVSSRRGVDRAGANRLRSLTRMLIKTLTDESSKSGLISDPVFRSSLVVAAGAMIVLAASLLLRQVKSDQLPTRILTIVSLASATATLLALLVGGFAAGS